MPDTPVKSRLREEVARWLGNAMAAAQLRDTDVIRKSGVAKTTFYRVKQGEADPDTSTLELLARALGVPVPSVEKRLIAKGPETLTAEDLVREAIGILERARAMLAHGATPDDLTTSDGVEQLMEAADRPARSRAAPRPARKKGREA
jgi:transcriptional regulator with XRE-family HTH domain